MTTTVSIPKAPYSFAFTDIPLTSMPYCSHRTSRENFLGCFLLLLFAFLSESDGPVGCGIACHLSVLTAAQRHSLISQRFAENYLFVGGVFFLLFDISPWKCFDSDEYAHCRTVFEILAFDPAEFTFSVN